MSDMDVTQAVFEQYQKMQRAGPCNMANKSCVQREANDRGFHDLVAFIEDGDYYALLQNYAKYDEKFGGDN